MDYLTVKQVAELKGCSERYIQVLIKNKKLQSEEQLHPQNKQPCYMISVSALPENLQAKYYKQKRTETEILPEKIEPENNSETALKYRLKGISGIFRNGTSDNQILDCPAE